MQRFLMRSIPKTGILAGHADAYDFGGALGTYVIERRSGMSNAFERPARPIPPEIAPLVGAVRDAFGATEIWLFGSRARGDFRPDSDWDLVAVLPDDATPEMTDPLSAWRITRQSHVPATLLATKRQDLESIWGLPNTVGFVLSREGVRLVD